MVLFFGYFCPQSHSVDDNDDDDDNIMITKKTMMMMIMVTMIMMTIRILLVSNTAYSSGPDFAHYLV